jgi:hypothetical protein
VRYETMDGLERYLVYGMGLWMDSKGAWSTVWFVGSSYSSYVSVLGNRHPKTTCVTMCLGWDNLLNN